MTDYLLEQGAIDAVANARHGDPFAILGPHEIPGGTQVRAFIPDAESVEVVDRATGMPVGTLDRVDSAGFWNGAVTAATPYRLKITTRSGTYETEDPYSFPAILGDVDIYLLAEGRHRDFASILGSHVTEMDGVTGVRFAVWAPNARRVSVVGAFNHWDGRRHPMRLRHGSGVWELFVPRIGAGTIYKYEIVAPWGEVLPLKADPVAQATAGNRFGRRRARATCLVRCRMGRLPRGAPGSVRTDVGL